MKVLNLVNPITVREQIGIVKMDIDYQLKEPCRNTLVLTDINNEWMTSIQKYLGSDNSIIVVGLIHFMYDCGLISPVAKFGLHNNNSKSEMKTTGNIV